MIYDENLTNKIRRISEAIGLQPEILQEFAPLGGEPGLRVGVDVVVLERLTGEILALKKLAVSQAASVALLTSLLATKGSLSYQEASMIALAGQSTQEHDLTPEQAQKWIREHMLKGKRGDQ